MTEDLPKNPGATGLQMEIRWQMMLPHPSWPDAETYPAVWIDLLKFDAAWRMSDQWVGPGGRPGGHGGRYSKAGRWFLAGDVTDMCQIWINEEGVGFTDGRHRFAWLRDRRVSAIPVQVSPDGLELCVSAFASDIQASILNIPTE